MERPSIFEFAGGEPAFLALATAFHERCLEDPELNHVFAHQDNPQHIGNLAAYWAEVFGGPPRYSRSLGGHSRMLEIHAGEGATDDLGNRFVACFVQALDDAELPADPSFRSSLHSYIRWAVDEVNTYSPAGSTVPADEPMPRWSWDGPEAVRA